MSRRVPTCITESEYDSHAQSERTTLIFLSIDELPVRHRLAFVVQDVNGQLPHRSLGGSISDHQEYRKPRYARWGESRIYLWSDIDREKDTDPCRNVTFSEIFVILAAQTSEIFDIFGNKTSEIFDKNDVKSLIFRNKWWIIWRVNEKMPIFAADN